MKAFLTTAAALLALTIAAAGQEAGDPRLAGDVDAAVRRCPQLTIFDDVGGRVDAGVVTLEGKVTGAHKKAAIEQRVAAVAGVRGLRNLIEVLPDSPADEALRRGVARAIYGNPAFWNDAAMPHPPIRILVESGRVRLTGRVRSDGDRALAGSLAAGAGAAAVSNDLRVQAGY